MNFLKCIFCGEGPIKIWQHRELGCQKSKCLNCGLNSTQEPTKTFKTKGPEVIYK